MAQTQTQTPVLVGPQSGFPNQTYRCFASALFLLFASIPEFIDYIRINSNDHKKDLKGLNYIINFKAIEFKTD